MDFEKMYGLDDEGEPVEFGSIEEWSTWRRDKPDQIVLRQHKFVGLMVSTVFLCFNHGFDDGAPVLWETMVFGSNAKGLADIQERYTNRKDALAGHYAALSRAIAWAKKLNPGLYTADFEKEIHDESKS